jgi:hypothetical protein
MSRINVFAIATLMVFLVGCTQDVPSENKLDIPASASASASATKTSAPPVVATPKLEAFDISTTFYKNMKEVDVIFGKSTGGHRLKDDASNRGRIPGVLREYAPGKHWKYALVRFYKDKCVSVQLELPSQYETAEEALLSVGLDVSAVLPVKTAPLATRWTAKVGDNLFKDISAYRTEMEGKFEIIAYELADPE